MLTLGDLIKKSPVVELSRLETGSSVIYANLACMNPSGSVKDIMASYMLDQAEARGELKPGTTILELTTGNTGIAFARLAAIRGYRFVAVMPEHMSVERRMIMRAYGGEVVLTPAKEDMAGAKRRYLELRDELAPNLWLPDQFANEDNIRAHYQTTGENIASQVDGKIDFFVAGVGTGGTFLGVAKRLRETHPECVMVAVEPEESAVLSGGESDLHGIQGIGEGFVPELLQEHLGMIDEVATVSTAAAEAQTRDVVRREGIFAGISSGANVAVALRYARQYPGSRIVTIIPDRGERYLSQGLFEG
jgi:cysteine synthase A